MKNSVIFLTSFHDFFTPYVKIREDDRPRPISKSRYRYVENFDISAGNTIRYIDIESILRYFRYIRASLLRALLAHLITSDIAAQAYTATASAGHSAASRRIGDSILCSVRNKMRKLLFQVSV